MSMITFKNGLYLIKTEAGSVFLKCHDECELFAYIKNLQENENTVVISTKEIRIDGSTPKVRVFTNPDFKKTSPLSPDEDREEMIGQIIDQLEDLLCKTDEQTLFDGPLYKEAANIIRDTLDKWND